MVLTTSSPCCMVTVSFIGIGILAFGASQIENLQSVSLNLQQDCCVIWKIIFLVLWMDLGPKELLLLPIVLQIWCLVVPNTREYGPYMINLLDI